MLLLPEIVAGGGLGLLVGFLLGLSVSQVVGGVVAALAALLGAFLGLTNSSPERAWRTGAFGLFCVAGVALGLAVRSGSLLAPSITQEVATWTAAGYSPQQGRSFVAFQRLGVKPDGVTLAEASKPGAGSNALFANEAKGVCNDLEGLPAAVQLKELHRRGAPYDAIATAAEAATDPAAALASALKPICG